MDFSGVVLLQKRGGLMIFVGQIPSQVKIQRYGLG